MSDPSKWQRIETAPVNADVLIYLPPSCMIVSRLRKTYRGEMEWTGGPDPRDGPPLSPTSWRPLPDFPPGAAYKAKAS